MANLSRVEAKLDVADSAEAPRLVVSEKKITIMARGQEELLAGARVDLE